MDKEMVRRALECIAEDRQKSCTGCEYSIFGLYPFCVHGIARDALALLQEQEAKPPVHIHEEYPEHDWVRDKNGDIDDFAYDGDYHNGPMCKRCHYAFCIYCKPDGWNKEQCIIDEYKCPKCGRYIIERTKFCSNCGQAVKWDE